MAGQDMLTGSRADALRRAIFFSLLDDMEEEEERRELPFGRLWEDQVKTGPDGWQEALLWAGLDPMAFEDDVVYVDDDGELEDLELYALACMV